MSETVSPVRLDDLGSADSVVVRSANILLFAIIPYRPTIYLLVVSVQSLGRYLASIFSTLSCFPPFSLVPHTTLLSETHSVYPIVSFPLVFFLSSDPLLPPLVSVGMFF